MTEYDSLRLRPWRLIVDANEWKLIGVTGEQLAIGCHTFVTHDDLIASVAFGWSQGASPTIICPGVYEWPLTPEEESIVDEQVEIDKVDEWARSRARAEDTP